jgi:hypothetical protein
LAAAQLAFDKVQQYDDEAPVHHLDTLLKQAATLLKQVVEIMQCHVFRVARNADTNRSGGVDISWSGWLRKESQIRVLTGALHKTRENITATLTAFTT